MDIMNVKFQYQSIYEYLKISSNENRQKSIFIYSWCHYFTIKLPDSLKLSTKDYIYKKSQLWSSFLLSHTKMVPI